MTSYSSIVLARTNWRKDHLHQSLTAVNINISPPGIHGLACKKLFYLLLLLWRYYTIVDDDSVLFAFWTVVWSYLCTELLNDIYDTSEDVNRHVWFWLYHSLQIRSVEVIWRCINIIDFLYFSSISYRIVYHLKHRIHQMWNCDAFSWKFFVL